VAAFAPLALAPAAHARITEICVNAVEPFADGGTRERHGQ
jgi:hypothetical protein